MSGESWVLDLDAERDVLIPWLDEHSDDRDRCDLVAAFLAELVRRPLGRGREERPGIFTATVPRVGGVLVVWTLDFEKKAVVLAIVD